MQTTSLQPNKVSCFCCCPHKTEVNVPSVALKLSAHSSDDIVEIKASERKVKSLTNVKQKKSNCLCRKKMCKEVAFIRDYSSGLPCKYKVTTGIITGCSFLGTMGGLYSLPISNVCILAATLIGGGLVGGIFGWASASYICYKIHIHSISNINKTSIQTRNISSLKDQYKVIMEFG